MITPCAARKRQPPKLLAQALPLSGQVEVSAAWLALLACATPDLRATDLYVGSGFGKAKRAASQIGADLAIISAGLGLVMGNTIIPSYDLALSRGGVRSQVTGDFDPVAWWDAISSGPYAADVARALKHRPLLLVCLSRAYAPLVVPALQTIAPERLRIFGLGLERVLPPDLAACVLPYDTRLGVTISKGTLADFAQRALLHYVNAIYQERPSLERDKAAVSAIFKSVAKPIEIQKRTTANDDALREIIANLLPTFGPRRSAMLRHLRDVIHVACEQGRFARLFMEVVLD